MGYDRVVREMLKGDLMLDTKDEMGRTALMEACLGYKQDVIDLLLIAKADVNLADNNGCTALMRAAYAGYTGLVIQLLDYGADKDMEDEDGRKAIDYVRDECRRELEPLLS